MKSMPRLLLWGWFGGRSLVDGYPSREILACDYSRTIATIPSRIRLLFFTFIFKMRQLFIVQLSLPRCSWDLFAGPLVDVH